MYSKKVTGNESTRHAVSVHLPELCFRVSQRGMKSLWEFRLYMSPVSLSGSPSSHVDTSPLHIPRTRTPSPWLSLFTLSGLVSAHVYSPFSESWWLLSLPCWIKTWISLTAMDVQGSSFCPIQWKSSHMWMYFRCAHREGWVPLPSYSTILFNPSFLKFLIPKNFFQKQSCAIKHAWCISPKYTVSKAYFRSWKTKLWKCCNSIC